MASNSATLIHTHVKAYVDAQLTASDLGIAGDSGTGTVDLDSEVLDIAGGTGISTAGADNTQGVSIADNTAVTAGIYGNATQIAFTVDAKVELQRQVMLQLAQVGH